MIYRTAYTVFAFWAASASASGGSLCEGLVWWETRASAQAFETSLKEEVRANQMGLLPAPDSPKLSVRNFMSFEGPNGGLIYVAQRTPGLRWYSLHSKLGVGSIRPDIQGDPRMGLVILGYDLARVVSVRAINGRTLLLGDAAEIGQQISQFNVYLEARGLDTIPVQYSHSSASSDLIAHLEKYLENYLRYGILPVEDPQRSWGHFLHDIGFHTSFIMVTPELYEKHRQMLRGQMLFLQFAKHKFSELLSPRLARMAYRALLLSFSSDLDIFTARLFQSGYFLILDRNRPERRMIPGRYIVLSGLVRHRVGDNLSQQSVRILA